MGQKAFKHQQGSIVVHNLRFDGGVNYAQAPANIADNELTAAYNYIYDAQSGTPEIRPGTTCQTAAVCDSTNAILKIYYYEKDTTYHWLVGVCNGNLYYLSGTGLDAWTKIGALNDITTVPTFVTYHSKLLIADGGTNIKTWDGTTYSALADGLGATVISVIKGRVVVNSSASGSADLVTMSGAEDETEWDTAAATNPAVGLRVGYGDNMVVNAFSVFGDDLIVSKKGGTEKRLYRINVENATITNWYVQLVTDNNASQSAHTIVSAFNNVFFMDKYGFKSLSGVTEYGDLQVDSVGAKINSMFSSAPTCYEVTYLPYFNAIWCLMSDHIYAYHRILNPANEIAHAFTEIGFQQGIIRSICQAGSAIYMAGGNGYLYAIDLSSTYATDETAPDTTSSYMSTLQTKRFAYFSGAVLRKTELYLDPLIAGTAYLYAMTQVDDYISLKAITLRSKGELLNDATGYLHDAQGFLHDTAMTSWFETCRNRVRGGTLQFKLTCASGRVAVEGLKAEVALVEG